MVGIVTTRVTGFIGEIIISNPDRKNAMSSAMWRELRNCAIDMQANDYARVVILRGADGTFVAGADLTEFKALREDTDSFTNYLSNIEDAVSAVFNLSKPTIAAVEGHCIGGGLAIAAACDFRYATTSSIFQIPSARLGLSFPEHSVRRIASLIGITNTKRLLFTAERITAQEAKEMGLVSDVIEGDIRAAFEHLCVAIQDNAPLSITASKRVLNGYISQDKDLDEISSQYAYLTVASRDFNEALTAMEEKRKPNFIGK